MGSFFENLEVSLHSATAQVVILRSEATKNLAFSGIFQPGKEILRSLRSLRMTWWGKLRCSDSSLKKTVNCEPTTVDGY